MSYPRLKALKHSVSINLSCSEFSFMNILIDNLLMQFFYIQNRKMCLSKKILFQLKILRTWIKIRASSFIKTWGNIMNQKSTNMPGKLPVAEKSKPALQRNCTKIGDISLIFIHFFFSQTNLFLKFNLVFINMLDSFHYNSFIPFHYWYTDLKPLLRPCEVRV